MVDAAAAQALLTRVRERGPTLWLLHVNADPDCVGSAHALQEAFGGTVGAPEGLSRPGGRLAERLGLDVDIWPHPEQYANVVAVDTSSRSQLGRLGARAVDPLIVDHHAYGDLLEQAPAHAWDPDRASCAEVALALLDLAGHAPSPTAAFGLLAGLVADTARFQYADAASFAAAGRLLAASGARMGDVLDLLSGDANEADDAQADLAHRRALLLAASRAHVETAGAFLLATSEVSSFDAAAAGALVRIGADVAVVGRARGSKARLSLRASPRALATGLHLGEVANATAREAGWSGGGHDGAAGLNGTPPLADVRAALVARLRTHLEAGA